MEKGKIVVMSDSPIIGNADCGVEFISIPSPPDLNVINEDEREVKEIMAVRAASRLIVRLGNSDVVFLQHLAGNVISGGPIGSADVLRQISFADVGMEIGETEEQVRKRLIVFATCPEEAEEDMPVIDLPYLQQEDLGLPWSVLEIRQHHPLSRFIRLARDSIG